MKIEGASCTDPVQIKNHVVSFYKGLYHEERMQRTLFDNLQLSSLQDDKACDLEVVFSEDEVYRALCSMDNDKTPGLDGLPMEVYKKT